MLNGFRPRLIFWELTTGCNLRCIHCRASATELASPDDLNTQSCLRLIDQFAEYAPLVLVLSGGEPLYRKDVLTLATYAGAKGLKVALATNGTLLEAEMAQRIHRAGIVRVAISLDGADAQTHDSFRGLPGSFYRALNGIHLLQAAGVQVQINTTVARHNAHQLPDVYNLALSLGVNALHTFLLVPVGCGLSIAAGQMLPPGEYEQILNWFYEREREQRIELKATCAPHYYRVRKQRQVEEKKAATAAGLPVPDFTPKAHSHHADLAAVTRGCLAGSGVCFVSHKGEVFPCGYLPVRAGDLRAQPFREIWEQAAIFQELRDTSNLKGKCAPCEFRNLCEGCRARAYAATGDYLQEEPYCAYTPKSLVTITGATV